MRLQDFLADTTLYNSEALIRQVERLGDKATWTPMDEGRTALDQLAECALINASAPKILETFQFPQFTEEDMAKYHSDKAALDTVDKAATALRDTSKAAADAIRRIPDEKLSDTMNFWGPEPWKIADVAAYLAWNMTYHNGQVCYIQTLAGDKEMAP